jgi:Flp pilus assembly pilin Flp
MFAVLLSRLVRDRDAQDIAEYGIALAVIALLAAGIVMSISADTRAMWARALQTLVIVSLGN